MGAGSRRALDVPGRLGLALLPACWPWGPGAPPSHPQLFLRPPLSLHKLAADPGTRPKASAARWGGCWAAERPVGYFSQNVRVSACRRGGRGGPAVASCALGAPGRGQAPQGGLPVGGPAGPSGASVSEQLTPAISILFCGPISSRLKKKTQTWLSWT